MLFFSKRAFSAALALSVVGCADANDSAETESQPAYAAQAVSSKTIDIPVTVHGGKATTQALVYANAAATGTGTILSVPGFNATGKIFANLTQALFADPATGPGVKQVITVDFPGHGGAAKPTGAKFGDLTIEDNAAALVQSLQALSAQSLSPGLIVGYGAGGLTVAVAQEQLLASGSSLAKLGVKSVLLYAPTPSADSPWTMQPLAATINDFVKTSPADGAVYSVPDANWNRAAFTNKAGTVLANAPTGAQVTAGGYSAPEPAAVLSQLRVTSRPAAPRSRVRTSALARSRRPTAPRRSWSRSPRRSRSRLLTWLPSTRT